MPKRKYKNFFIRILIALIFLVFIQNCQVTPKQLSTEIIPSVSDSEKIPLRVGLFIDDKLKNTTAVFFFGGGEQHIGGPLSSACNDVANKTFREVVIVPGVDNHQDNLDAIVIPEVVEARQYISGGWVITTATAVVKVKWVIKDKKNNIIYLNTFAGEAKMERGGINTQQKYYNALIAAIEDQSVKAVNGIKAGKWWQQIPQETK